MGYLSMGKCHDTLDLAVDAYYTSSPMLLWPAPKIGISYFAKDTGGWYLHHVSLIPEIASPPDTRLGAAHYVSCDVSDAFLSDSYLMAFGATITLFILGLSIGLVISLLRKAQRI